MSELENFDTACEMTVCGFRGIGTRLLRQRKNGAYLATTESSGNGGCSSLDTGEEGVEDTLASEEGEVGLQLLSRRARRANGPELQHRVLRLLALELGFEHNVLLFGLRLSGFPALTVLESEED